MVQILIFISHLTNIVPDMSTYSIVLRANLYTAPPVDRMIGDAHETIFYLHTQCS